MFEEMKKELILEHYSNPVNRGLTHDESYISESKSNPSCIDHFTIELKIKDNIIEDIRFDGEACAIATSSLSISITKLIGKTKEEALDIIDNYNKMISGENFDESKLEELSIYKDIHKQPARAKCAYIGINGIKDLIEKN